MHLKNYLSFCCKQQTPLETCIHQVSFNETSTFNLNVSWVLKWSDGWIRSKQMLYPDKCWLLSITDLIDISVVQPPYNLPNLTDCEGSPVRQQTVV